MVVELAQAQLSLGEVVERMVIPVAIYRHASAPGLEGEVAA